MTTGSATVPLETVPLDTPESAVSWALIAAFVTLTLLVLALARRLMR